MSWPEICIGPHIDLVAGAAFKSSRFSDDATNIALVKGENIGQGEILWKKSKYWPREDAEPYERFKLVPGDIVLAMDRPWVTAGLKFAVIRQGDPEALLVQRVARLRGTEDIRSDFLRHIVASQAFESYLKNIMGGTNVPHISGDQIRAFKCPLPPPPIQERISDVLSAYDDLIANNRRRIALLEDTTRLLYREWFVHFRFPGHEHVKITDGVPEGWEATPFSDLADFVNGYPFAPNELGEVGLPIVKIPELRDGVTQRTPRNAGETIPEKYRLKDGDLLFSWSGTLLVEFWYHGAAILNQHLFRVDTNARCSSVFMLLALREALPRFANQTTGATLRHIRRAALETVKTNLPPRSLREDFDEIGVPFYSQILNLRRQNLGLIKARDLLLPKLMSGEVEV